MKYASDNYGEVTTLEDFTAKAMQIHAEAMRAEAEFARSNEGITAGFMNWMYSDIWPSGSWSAIDYWCEPKQVYYQMKRSYAPQLITFVENGKGETELVVVNDTLNAYSTAIRYGVKTLDGTVLYEANTAVNGLIGVYKEKVNFDCNRADVYLFAEYAQNGENASVVYSPKLWSGVRFTSDYEVKTEKLDACSVKVTIKANAFAKSVFISMKDNYKYTYSDNYIDVEAGKEKSVIITANEPIDEAQITVTDFAKMTV
jgi:beta-galactosidase/beta-glucuronidase